MVGLSNTLLAPLAAESGIDLIGVVPAGPAPHFDFFARWLTQGYGAGMGYLERRGDMRRDSRALVPEARSVIMAAVVYKQSREEVENFHREKGFKVAQYAWGKDYHDVLKRKLLALGEQLHSHFPEMQSRVYVDTGPILERDYAALAGLGWIGKNTCLIHPKKGSFIFLGSLLTNLPCEGETSTPMADHCGRCRACIDACPTGALVAPYTLDARKCISYWTIEHRGEFPPPESFQYLDWKEWIFGCDSCQEVCPWNRKAAATSHPEFALSDFLRSLKTSEDILAMDANRSLPPKSPLKRTGIAGLKRNVEKIL